MKAILIEPLLVATTSLLWIIVLPLAAVVCSGLTISERVAAYKAGELSGGWSGQSDFRAAARPSHLA